MRNTLMSYVGTENKFEGVIQRWSYYLEPNSGRTIATVVIEDVRDSEGTLITNHAWLKVNKSLLKIRKDSNIGDKIKFEAYVTDYSKKGGYRDYGFIDVKDVVIVREDLIIEDDLEQSVINLYKANCTYKEIERMLGVYTDKIKRIIRQNDDMGFEHKVLLTTIMNLCDRGFKVKEIAEITGLSVATVYTYLPIKKSA